MIYTKIMQDHNVLLGKIRTLEMQLDLALDNQKEAMELNETFHIQLECYKIQNNIIQCANNSLVSKINNIEQKNLLSRKIGVSNKCF